MAATSSATDIVHPALMPFSRLCHLVVKPPTVHLIFSMSMRDITTLKPQMKPDSAQMSFGSADGLHLGRP